MTTFDPSNPWLLAGTATVLLLAASTPLLASGELESPDDLDATATLAEEERADEAAPTFRTVDTGVNGSELNIGLTSDGTIFLGGWDAIARSTDAGDTWDALGLDRPVSIAADRVLVVDRETDRVFVDDTTLACTLLSWSDDLGESWTTNPVACGGGATDHQKIAVGDRTELTDPTGELYPNVVYVCANGLTHTPCAPSLDGGRTFGPGMPSQQLDAANPGDSQTTCAFQGVPKANDAGTLYQPSVQCGAQVWWSEDNALTWTHSTIDVSPSPDAPDLALDDDTVYFFYTTSDWEPMYVYSTDGGETFSDPVSVAAEDLTSSLFPVITAGEDGRIGVAYYATTDDDPDWDGNPGDAPDEVSWNLYSAVVDDAATEDPAVHLTQVTTDEDPIQYGPISKLGSNLNNIADYIDIELGPDGKLHIGYVDGCPACEDVDSSTADDGYVAIQDGGLELSP